MGPADLVTAEAIFPEMTGVIAVKNADIIKASIGSFFFLFFSTG
jgi:hypothetical protein